METLWRRRTILLNELSLVLGCSEERTAPIRILTAAIEALDSNNLPEQRLKRLKGLLNSLNQVRKQLFIELQKQFTGVFTKARLSYGEEGVAILSEKLLQCIDRCCCGQENTFPAYFMKYALRGFSEIEDDRMGAGFTISRKTLLNYRRDQRLTQLSDQQMPGSTDTLEEELPLRRSDYFSQTLAVYETPETILEAKETLLERLPSLNNNQIKNPGNNGNGSPPAKFWWHLALQDL